MTDNITSIDQPTQNPTATGSAAGDSWWKNVLDTHSQCIWAVRAAALDGDVDDCVYAVEKPWKYAREAWLLYVQESEGAQ